MSSRSFQSPPVASSADAVWPVGPAAGVLRESGPLMVALAWAALVAVAVAGRLWQPEWNGTRLWNVTPLVAVALAAGGLFGNRLVAAAAPLVALAISNLFEPPYKSFVVAAAVYAASAWPVLLGSLARRGGWLGVLGGAVASSLVFFVVTNFAHWAVMGDYTPDWAGLVECYRQAILFYRPPLADVLWSLAFFAGIAAVTVALGRFEAVFGGRQAAVRVTGAGAGAGDPRKDRLD
jgi:hypothetical protein